MSCCITACQGALWAPAHPQGFRVSDQPASRMRSVRPAASPFARRDVIAEDTKQLFVNGKREALARYLDNLDVFVFSLEEMHVIRGEPAGATPVNVPVQRSVAFVLISKLI